MLTDVSNTSRFGYATMKITQEIRPGLPLPTMLRTVKYVNDITPAILHLVQILMHISDTLIISP